MKSEADSSSLGREPFARASGMLATVSQTLLEKGRGNKHTSFIACLATVFVSRCWGYSLGLF